jgi:hypothetical protein
MVEPPCPVISFAKMRYFIIVLFICFLFSVISHAQKHDYVWELGHDGGTILNFNSNPPLIELANRNSIMHLTNVSMSDSSGNLIFYTNGCNIYNTEDNIMEGGEDINPGSLHDNNCSGSFNSYTAARGAIAVPRTNEMYYLFHKGGEIVFEPQIDVYLDKLYYTVINMGANSGMGKVVQKNVLIIKDTLQSVDLCAVKHANNTDWWMIVPKRASNNYFKIRFFYDNSITVEYQVIGDSTLYIGDGGGQALFSPDGTKYIRYNPVDEIQIFDFDRSTGELSNYKKITIPGDTAFVGGAAISANSRYLYISSQIRFYQYDLQAPDIAASQVLLGEYDGYQSPFPIATTFYHCQLAPDCKIYCNCYNGCDVLHVVNNPDEPGLACDFVQHGVQLPTSNALSLPNFPNYRLDTGQPPCVPTASGELAASPTTIKVYPNPATGQVTVALPAALRQAATWSLHDALGREVRRALLPAGEQQAEVGLTGLAPGLYLWRVEAAEGGLGSGKLIVIK